MGRQTKTEICASNAAPLACPPSSTPVARSISGPLFGTDDRGIAYASIAASAGHRAGRHLSPHLMSEQLSALEKAGIKVLEGDANFKALVEMMADDPSGEVGRLVELCMRPAGTNPSASPAEAGGQMCPPAAPKRAATEDRCGTSAGGSGAPGVAGIKRTRDGPTIDDQFRAAPSVLPLNLHSDAFQQALVIKAATSTLAPGDASLRPVMAEGPAITATAASCTDALTSGHESCGVKTSDGNGRAVDALPE